MTKAEQMYIINRALINLGSDLQGWQMVKGVKELTNYEITNVEEYLAEVAQKNVLVFAQTASLAQDWLDKSLHEQD